MLAPIAMLLRLACALFGHTWAVVWEHYDGTRVYHCPRCGAGRED